MVDSDHDQPTIETEEITEKLTSPRDLSDTVPGFRLLQKLGEGGMGEVYEAEQLEPVRRKVALKLIKRGMESKEVLARFDSERQALALMSHPNIAQVYDAGTSADGRPYFVMEFVPGMSLTEYCDRNRLNTNERLALFIEICDGVQHAHHKGVIHRDIKPSNVMVMIQDSKAVPKIIDFGIAKATSQRLTEESVFTAMGEFIGTPEYMSPEQADLTGLDVDTRTDVYSLGVVLYEMLVGIQPFDGGELRRAGFDEMRRVIREDEPPRPSTRLSGLGEDTTTAAKNRRSEPSTLRRQLKGDLDWIAMKALEKDRTRRYSSPGELASDIERHLRDQPVQAGPPSTAYRFTKFVRRHTLGFIAGTIVFLALVLGIFGTTLGMVRARNAEQEASREAETAKQVSDFLVGLFKVSNPTEGSFEKVTAREVLDKGTERIRVELTDQPLVQARLMSTMGWVYIGLGIFDTAQGLFEDCLAIREAELPPDHPDIAEVLNQLGESLREQAKYDEAWPFYERALVIREQTAGPESPRVAAILNNMALILSDRGDYDGALKLYERMLAIDSKTLEPGDPVLGMGYSNVAILHVRLGEFDEALELFEKALEINRNAFGEHHRMVASSLNSIGGVLGEMGDYPAALPYLEKAAAIKEDILGPDHPSLAGTLGNLGTLLISLQEHDRAQVALERAVVIYRESLGPDHPAYGESLSDLATLFLSTEDLESAGPLLEESLAVRERAFGPHHSIVASCLNNLGVYHRALGDDEMAKVYHERALVAFEEALGPDHPEVAKARANVARLLTDLGEYEEAEELFMKSLEVQEQVLGLDHPDIGYTTAGLGSLYDAMGEPERARPYRARTIYIWENSLEAGHPDLVSAMEDYEDLLLRLGEVVEAGELAARIAAARVATGASETQ